jgi:4'-phosphopantetheinyl transferase
VTAGHRPVEGVRSDAVRVVWTLLAEFDVRPDDLDARDRERAARMAPGVRERWVAGRGWVRTQLAGLLGGRPVEVPLHATGTGRPILPGTGLEISIAHTDVVVALAIGVRPLGVDVEAPPPPSEDLLGLAAVVGTPSEVATLAAADPTRRPRLFQRWWVAKEAVLKAAGTGFLDDPRAVEVGVGIVRPPQPWRVHELGDLVDGQFCAVAEGSGSLVLDVARA